MKTKESNSDQLVRRKRPAPAAMDEKLKNPRKKTVAGAQRRVAQEKKSVGKKSVQKRRTAAKRYKSKEVQSSQKPERERKKIRKPEKQSVAPEVVYLPPKPFSRNRLILRLATVAAVVLALMLGVSVFFRIETVVVYGTEKYSANDIREASGLNPGDSLLTFSRAQAAGKIIGTLPYVQNVRFGIKLPGTVNIEIVEVAVAYSVQDQHDNWWLVSAEGKVLERIPVGAQLEHTQIAGIRLNTPQVGSMASAYERDEIMTDPEGNTIPVTVTEAQKLKTGLDIAQYLELNGMISEVVSFDVSQLGDIHMQYGDRYLVSLGDTSQLSYKISCLKASVQKLTAEYPYDTGELDLSDPEHISFRRAE